MARKLIEVYLIKRSSPWRSNYYACYVRDTAYNGKFIMAGSIPCDGDNLYMQRKIINILLCWFVLKVLVVF